MFRQVSTACGSGHSTPAAQAWSDIRSAIELPSNVPSLPFFQSFVQALNEFDQLFGIEFLGRFLTKNAPVDIIPRGVVHVGSLNVISFNEERRGAS